MVLYIYIYIYMVPCQPTEVSGTKSILCALASLAVDFCISSHSLWSRCK